MYHHIVFFKTETALDAFLEALPTFLEEQEVYRVGRDLSGPVWVVHLTSQEAWGPDGPQGNSALIHGRNLATHHSFINKREWDPQQYDLHHSQPSWSRAEEVKKAAQEIAEYEQELKKGQSKAPYGEEMDLSCRDTHLPGHV